MDEKGDGRAAQNCSLRQKRADWHFGLRASKRADFRNGKYVKRNSPRATKRSASRSSRRDQRAGRFGSGLWCEKLIALPKAFCDTASVECQLMLQERGKADTPGSSISTNNQQRSFVTKQCPRLPEADGQRVIQSKREYRRRWRAYQAKQYHCGATLSRRRSIDRAAGCVE